MAKAVDPLTNSRRLAECLFMCADRLDECIEPGCSVSRMEYLIGCIRIDLRRLIDAHVAALANLSEYDRLSPQGLAYQRAFDIARQAASELHTAIAKLEQ